MSHIARSKCCYESKSNIYKTFEFFLSSTPSIWSGFKWPNRCAYQLHSLVYFIKNIVQMCIYPMIHWIAINCVAYRTYQCYKATAPINVLFILQNCSRTLSSKSRWSRIQTNCDSIDKQPLFAWWARALCRKDHWQNARRLIGLLFREFWFRGKWFGTSIGTYAHQTAWHYHIGSVSIATS